jgi:8-oxo-dGTP diphosphatase
MTQNMEHNRSAARSMWKKELSAGGIVYRRGDNGTFVLLVMPKRRDEKEIWSFPKGWGGDHEGEAPEQTALREVREEGGVEAKIIQDLGAVDYFFMWEGARIAKTVRYYLMEYISGDPQDHDHEIRTAEWVKLANVSDRLSYKTDKEVFARAEEALQV